jgi:hypothetical protein
MYNTPLDLTSGWSHQVPVPGGHHLQYNDGLVEVSIVTGPKGSGLMASNSPGEEPTYEAWFQGLQDPTGYLTLQEITGIIKYLRQRAREDAMHQS